MSTIRKIIERVDENKPNSFSTETKVLWLAQLDGKITADVFLMDVAEVRQFTYDPVTDLDTELLVRFPHDDIYYYWLCAKIDAENGEYDKYQNTMQLYNASYNNFANWFLGCYEPADGCGFRRRVPSYYITAYGLAVKRGFEGNLDQWLASLRGMSAYAVAQANGFEGTQAEWLASLVGPQGERGIAGIVGPDGKNGKDGKDGQDGYTPQKGVDYYTEAEQAALAEVVTAAVVGAVGLTQVDLSNFENGSFTETVNGQVIDHSVTFDAYGRPATVDGVRFVWDAATAATEEGD